MNMNEFIRTKGKRKRVKIQPGKATENAVKPTNEGQEEVSTTVDKKMTMNEWIRKAAGK